MVNEEMKELVKYWIREEMQKRDKCLNGKCDKDEVGDMIDKYHVEKWQEQRNMADPDDTICGYCSYSAPGVGIIHYGERGCKHRPNM